MSNIRSVVRRIGRVWPVGRVRVDLCIGPTDAPMLVSSPHKHANDVSLMIVKFRCASLHLGIGVLRVRKAKVCSMLPFALTQANINSNEQS